LTVLYSRSVSGSDASSRSRLLAGAADLHRALDLPALLRGLHPGALAQQAGVSRTSFYANWETNDAFWADLVDYVCRAALPPAVDPQHPVALNPPSDIPFMRTAVRQAFVRGLQRPELPLLMLLWSKAGDRRVGDALRRGYDAMLAPLVPRYEQYFKLWGREPRPPLSMRDITTIFVALNDGLAVRHQFDPAGAPPTLFEDAMVALLPAVTREARDRGAGPIDRAMAEFLPSRAHDPSEVHAVSSRRARSHAAILDAFERLVSDRGYRHVKMADVAQRARTSATTVYEHFGSKAALALDVAAQHAAELADHLDALPSDMSIEECLELVYDHVAEHRYVYDAAHVAVFEEPHTVPAPGVRNPIVQALATRIEREIEVAAADDAAPRTEPSVLAALWWRSLLTSAMLRDVPADGAELARVLVRGIASAGGAPAARVTLPE
jgi:AcrR family transcriptional regulator